MSSLLLQLVRSTPGLHGFGFFLGLAFVSSFGAVAHAGTPWKNWRRMHGLGSHATPPRHPADANMMLATYEFFKTSNTHILTLGHHINQRIAHELFLFPNSLGNTWRNFA